MNWFFEGIIVNIVWSLIVSAYSFYVKTESIQNLDLKKLKIKFYEGINFVILGTFSLIFAIGNLVYERYFTALIGLYPFIVSLFIIRNRVDLLVNFCDNNFNNKKSSSKKKSK